MKHFKKGIILFLSFTLIAVLCNILAFALPTSSIHINILESAATLQQEGPFFPLIGEKYRNSIADNNTDALMLLMADYNGEHNILEKSMGGYYKVSENTSNTGSYFFDMFISSMQENRIETGTNSYSRYWHGWMLPLRLLLMFFSYEDIRYLSMVILIFGLLYLVHTLLQKGFKSYAIVFLTSSLLILPITAAISFEYAFVYYVILFQNILLVKKYDKIQQTIGFGNYFMITGCLISYFDFLTYPLATLGFCIVTYLIFSLDTNPKKPWHLVQHTITYSITWAIGYFGMWVSKWLIGSMILGKEVLQSALGQLVLRTSSTAGLGTLEPENPITYFDTLQVNIYAFKTRGFMLVIILSALFLVWNIIKKKKYTYIYKYPVFIIPFALTFLMPFAWALVFKNHLFLHYNFTSNIFVISLLAVFSYLSFLLSYNDHS